MNSFSRQMDKIGHWIAFALIFFLVALGGFELFYWITSSSIFVHPLEKPEWMESLLILCCAVTGIASTVILMGAACNADAKDLGP